jgi:hypothetical protein
MPEKKEGCVQAAAGPLGLPKKEDVVSGNGFQPKEVRMTARVGKPAPDFEASALYGGAFVTVKLSEFLGKWVVLCFYPGDFTFV